MYVSTEVPGLSLHFGLALSSAKVCSFPLASLFSILIRSPNFQISFHYSRLTVNFKYRIDFLVYMFSMSAHRFI